MTISPFLIYLWGISENVHACFFVASVIGGVSCLGGAMASTFPFDERTDTAALIWKYIKRIACAAIVCGVISALIPDKKTIACMVVVPAIANSKVIQQDVPELYNMAVDALKESLTPAKK